MNVIAKIHFVAWGLCAVALTVSAETPSTQAIATPVGTQTTNVPPADALSLSPALNALITSISEDLQIEKSLRFYAQSKLQALSVSPWNPQAVKAALDQVFVAKGCVSRDVDDFLYQHALMTKIDAAIVGPEQREAWRRVQEADRHNVRAGKTNSKLACPVPPNPDDVASHVVEVAEFAEDGTPVLVKVRFTRPHSVALSENDTSLLGTDQDHNGLRDDVQAYIGTISQDVRIIKALQFYAIKETAIMLTDPAQRGALQAAWMQQQAAWACNHRDIRSQKLRNKLSRRVSAHIVNTEQRAAAMYRAKIAVSKLDPDPEATRRILCPLPEVAMR